MTSLPLRGPGVRSNDSRRKLGTPAGKRVPVASLGALPSLNGQAFTALKKVSTSLVRAEVYNDVAEKMKRLTALGEGLAEFGRPADALAFFNRALALSSEQPDAYFPFTAYLGKAHLLLERGSSEGRSML